MATKTATKVTVPDSMYALVRPNGELGFLEVSTGRKGTKWENYQFVNLLVGAPGDWRRIPMLKQQRANLLARLAENPLEAALRFSHHFTVCAACGSPLSDPESRERGLGPVCAAKF